MHKEKVVSALNLGLYRLGPSHCHRQFCRSVGRVALACCGRPPLMLALKLFTFTSILSTRHNWLRPRLNEKDEHRDACGEKEHDPPGNFSD